MPGADVFTAISFVRLHLHLSFVATANEMCWQRAIYPSAVAACSVLLHKEDDRARQKIFVGGDDEIAVVIEAG